MQRRAMPDADAHRPDDRRERGHRHHRSDTKRSDVSDRGSACRQRERGEHPEKMRAAGYAVQDPHAERCVRVTEMARQMVTKFGMSEKLGPLQYGKTDELIFLGRQIQEERNYSEEVAKIIDSEVHDIVDRARQRAYEVLTTNREKLDLIVSKLIEQETLESDQFNKLFETGDEGVPVAASTSGPDATPPGAPAGEDRRREKGEPKVEPLYTARDDARLAVRRSLHNNRHAVCLY